MDQYAYWRLQWLICMADQAERDLLARQAEMRGAAK